ncbi:MAG: succinyldiaminopimelate transaminase [Thiohalophilus sp.]|jgi:N-succinyldiaminopimelate aminotransferase
MNPELDKLHPYPFEKLAALKSGATPPADLEHIALSIGEPKHAAPAFVFDVIRDALPTLSSYPLTRGSSALRQAIAEWLIRRFNLPQGSIDIEQHILPVNGTREALFAFAQAVVDRRQDPLVLMPNPFYQIYEGAALLAGAEPGYLDCNAENGFIPDFEAIDAKTWKRCQLLYICSPGNPTGAVMDQASLINLMELAERHDFVIASDECYSEIYFDEDNPPVGLLQAASAAGNDQFKRCVVFHSLSKRSNLPGLRSGFVAGDADILQVFHRYRTYHGCAMPPHHQLASLAAWSDEQHVEQNRELYRRKFESVMAILQPVLPVEMPEAGFYLWPQTPVDDKEFARRLYAEQNVTVLPGQYLSRDNGQSNPGRNRVRMALVAEQDECVSAAKRIKNLLENL